MTRFMGDSVLHRRTDAALFARIAAQARASRSRAIWSAT